MKMTASWQGGNVPMKTNDNKSFLLIITVILGLGALASVIYYFSRPQTTSRAKDDQSIPQASEPVNTPVALTQLPVQEEQLIQTQNNVIVTISHAKIIATGIEISLCYTTLDGGDWYPVPGHLRYGAYDILPDQAEFTSETKADGINTGNRCVAIRYLIPDLNTISKPVQFLLLDVTAVPREEPTCQNFTERLNTSPAARAYGLKADCVENSDGSASFTLTGSDASAKTEDVEAAWQVLIDGTVHGPWVFSINNLEK